jgi:tryptophan synthase beta chain
VKYYSATDEEALAALQLVCKLEGIIPALESSHAIAWLLDNPGGDMDLVTLSGRGDKDLDEVMRLTGMKDEL